MTIAERRLAEKQDQAQQAQLAGTSKSASKEGK
jgi:preprotein translocase subunit SecD